MRHHLASSLSGLLTLALVSAAAMGGDVKSADEALKAKGLKKSGTTYVVAGEGEVQKKLNEAQGLYKQMTYALAEQHAREQELRDNKGMIQELTEQRIVLNRQLPQAGNVAQHNQIVSMLNETNDRLNLLRQQQVDPEAKKQAETQAVRRREAFMQSVIDLRVLVDAATQQYAAVAADDDVKAALDELGKASKSKPTLGPSRTFLANVKLLEKVEGTVLTETVDLRKEGGIYWVDVTFNGKVTKPMAFDTGAANVVLPSDFAAEIGLKPGPDDPTVTLQIADGSTVEARQMTVASMRLGKFTVKDVSCVIMPATKTNVPPLLGQTFQRHFTLKFSADSGKLTLSRVEAPEPAKPTAKTKGSTKAAGKR